ncbi:MAG: hypothetical protein F6J86_23110 [Symploca sp. SIO1B1]|nr:hypothetical protein [Symploca sp. SIO2D2]NER47561.1 hypothetical protein [Symploca sp. SIO1A3]NER96698.1 hypothetical protein [Symploca sp. SIO1B1]
MIPVTPREVRILIQEAKEAGVPKEDLEELQEYGREMASGVMKWEEPSPMYREITREEEKLKSDGGREVCLSTAPISSDEDDFEGVTFRPVKRRSRRKSA